MFSSLPLSLALLLSLNQDVLAVPQTTTPPGVSMSLLRRSPSPKTAEEWGVWAKSNKEMLGAKYGGSQPQKRSSGTNLFVFFYTLLSSRLTFQSGWSIKTPTQGMCTPFYHPKPNV